MPATYRPDIDVLRAISIFVVVMFHLQVPGFSGGFIGVDMFFVISGFLMTSIICREIEATGKLNFFAFCERRMRRILPALLATVFCVTIASLFAPTSTTESLRSQIISAATFTSNFYYWIVSGYFDNAATAKPLLHTWSLSVETQFYLFWPIALLALSKHLPISKTPGVIIAMLAISFVGSLFLTDSNQLQTLF